MRRIEAISPRRSMGLLFCACAVPLTIGCGELYGVWQMQWAFWPTALSALLISIVFAKRIYNDLFNPISIMGLAVLLRIGLPLLLAPVIEPPALLAGMPITFVHWRSGGVLAFTSMLAVLCGWLLTPGFALKSARAAATMTARKFTLDGRAAAVATLFVLLGVAFYWLFLQLNYSSPLSALTQGTVRDQLSRVAGTSRYNFIATGLLTYGSVMMCSYLLLVRRKSWMIGLLPAFAATAVLSANGGRVGALAPTVYGLILLWYRVPIRRIRLVKAISIAVLGTAVLVAYVTFLTAYRKGGGIAAGSGALSVNGLLQYIRFSVWYEIGAIYPYALATYFEPGIMHGAIAPLMGGFVSAILGFEGTRTGVFLINSFIDYSGRPWGIHTGLPVDLFVNFGIPIMVVGAALFGIVLHLLYSAMRARATSAGVVALYVVGLWHLIWVYYEHIISALDIFVLVVPFLWLLWIVSRLTPRAAKNRRARLPADAYGRVNNPYDGVQSV